MLALLGILLVAATMRTAVAGMSPIFDHIDREIPLDPLVLSVIGAAPPLVFGLSGFLAQIAARYLGLEGAVLAATIAGALGHLLRAVAPDPGLLLVGTVITLLGAGSANVLLPPLVKRYFPDRIGVLSAVYITIMSLGASVPPAIAVPVADSAGWRISLGVWMLASVIAAVPWIVQLVRTGRHVEVLDTEARGLEAAQSGLGARLFRSPLAWSMALLFVVPGLSTYVAFAWLPELTRELSGVDPTQAGLLTSVYAIWGLPVGIVVPQIAARFPRAVVPLIGLALVLFVVGYTGFLVAPVGLPLLWVSFLGVGTLLFPLTLTLINLRTRTQAGAVALSGFVQGIGYVLSASGPLVVGLLHDATGEWTAPLWFLLGTMLLAIPALVVLRRPRFVEDEGRPQSGG